MTARTLRSADVLLLAAHPLELEPFADALGAELRARLYDLELAAAAVGVGLAAAGGGAARSLCEHAPRAAVLIGSYGVYPGHGALAAACLLVPARVRAIDSAERAGKAAFPAAMAAEVEADATLCDALAASGEAIERGVVATTLGITTDDALARELGARSGCHGENLEALAVALACRAAGIAFAAVLACTNEVGAHGRAQWAQHRAAAADATAALVLRWLARGAPGLPPR
jgi:nucleoside phosphorylase